MILHELDRLTMISIELDRLAMILHELDPVAMILECLNLLEVALVSEYKFKLCNTEDES